MPEFIMPLGDQQTWQCLDEFTQGYWEAIFYTNANDSDDACNGMTFADVAKTSWERAVTDCQTFQSENVQQLTRAYGKPLKNGAYDAAGAGRDFWYTRCGHGVGFWDRGLGDAGEKLSAACEAWGNVDVMRGDDGKLHLEGGSR